MYVKKGKAQVQRHQYGQKYNGCSDGGKGSLYLFVSVSRSLSSNRCFSYPQSPISVEVLNINAYIHINEGMLQTTVVFISN